MPRAIMWDAVGVHFHHPNGVKHHSPAKIAGMIKRIAKYLSTLKGCHIKMV